MPNRMVPVSSAETLRATRSASAASARVRSACGRSVSATVVGTIPRPTRRNSGIPIVFSSARTCSEIDGCA